MVRGLTIAQKRALQISGRSLTRNAIPASGGTHQWNHGEGSGTTLTDSIASLDGSINGSTWISGAGTNDVHLKYDGEDDYTDLGSDSRSKFRHFVEDGEGTIFYWTKPDQISTRVSAISSSLSTSDVGVSIEYNWNSDGEIRWMSVNRNKEIWDTQGTNSALIADEWQPIAVTVDGSTAHVYQGNPSDDYSVSEVAADTFSTDDLISSNLDHNVALGRHQQSSDFYFDGAMDLLFIDTAVWSQSEIQSFAEDSKGYYL